MGLAVGADVADPHLPQLLERNRTARAPRRAHPRRQRPADLANLRGELDGHGSGGRDVVVVVVDAAAVDAVVVDAIVVDRAGVAAPVGCVGAAA
jgi:hypothetical protein